MTPITPTPPTYDIVGDADFNSRVIAPTGDVNKALGLGTKTSVVERDISGDGVADTIVSFANGKQLFVVSNYGETKMEASGTEDVYSERTTSSGGYWDTVEVSPASTDTRVTGKDCSERDAAIEIAIEAAAIAAENGGPTLGAAKGLKAAHAIPCKQITESVTIPAVTERVWIEGEPVTTQVKTGTQTAYKTVPTHNWSDIDGDSRPEVAAGTFRVKDMASGLTGPAWTFVVESPPPPPPPPPPTPPAGRGPKIGG